MSGDSTNRMGAYYGRTTERDFLKIIIDHTDAYTVEAVVKIIEQNKKYREVVHVAKIVAKYRVEDYGVDGLYPLLVALRDAVRGLKEDGNG